MFRSSSTKAIVGMRLPFHSNRCAARAPRRALTILTVRGRNVFLFWEIGRATGAKMGPPRELRKFALKLDGRGARPGSGTARYKRRAARPALAAKQPRSKSSAPLAATAQFFQRVVVPFSAALQTSYYTAYDGMIILGFRALDPPAPDALLSSSSIAPRPPCRKPPSILKRLMPRPSPTRNGSCGSPAPRRWRRSIRRRARR